MNKKSSLKADIIKTDIQRMSEQIHRNVSKFQAQTLSCAAVEVTIEGLNRVEKEFRENLSDPHSNFSTYSLTNEEGSAEEVVVLDWIIEGKIKLKEMKAEVETLMKSRQEIDRFTCENKFKALPKLIISPLTSPEVWLTWVGSINRVGADFSTDEISSQQFLSQVKNSIKIDEDRAYCANLQSVEDMMSYLKGK